MFTILIVNNIYKLLYHSRNHELIRHHVSRFSITSDESILQVFIDDVSDYLNDDLYDPSVVSISESSLRFAVNIFHLIIA